MIKGETIYLRMLDATDWEKTYIWHNDNELQRMTCGPIFVSSKEIEKQWVLSKATHNRNEIYFAICSLDNDEMIGFASLNDINHLFRSCYWGGIVIGDKAYRSGTEYLQASLLILDYAFNQLNLNRMTVSCLREHILARSQIPALYFKEEGVGREAVIKNGNKYDEYHYSLLRNEYIKHVENGDYDINQIIMRIVCNSKEIRKELKK